MPRMSIVATLTAGSILAALVAPGALAQPPGPGFVARANITVNNASSVPQIVVGTNVPAFELPPHHHAVLAMSVSPPAPPGDGQRLVRFYYSIGQTPGPQCRGRIDLSFAKRSTIAARDEATHCTAHSLGLGPAACNIAVSARNSECDGGLAFVAP